MTHPPDGGVPPGGYLPFKPQVSTPRARLPQGSCDCHFHVFEDGYPFGEPRSYTPTPAPLRAYRDMARAVGLDRAVLVHPSVYGRDHRSFEDTLAANRDWMRGVAVAHPDTPQADLARWHELGARGTRCNALFAGGTRIEDMAAVAERVRPYGWHLQLLVDVHAQPEVVSRVVALGLPVVVDHFGHLPAAAGIADPGFARLLEHVRQGSAWVKLSGAYRLADARRGFAQVRPLVDALLQANPDRLVWGSDWPHPAMAAPMVDDGDLADALFDWLDEAGRRKVLVENPSRLYWDD